MHLCLLMWEQERVCQDYQTEVLSFIREHRGEQTRHASGPVHLNPTSCFCYIYVTERISDMSIFDINLKLRSTEY